MFFNEIEAAKIAQNMEANGLEFYQRSAARTQDAGARRIFLDLAEDEKAHLALFEELEETLQARRRDGPGYADDAEIGAYIGRLLQTQVFTKAGDAGRLADQAGDAYEAFATAMRAERDAIVFYQEMLDFIDSKEAKDAFEKILVEERKHLRTLGDRAEALGH
jgi:rubrerythrin